MVLRVGQLFRRDEAFWVGGDAEREQIYLRRATLIGCALFLSSLPYGPLLAWWGWPHLGTLIFVTTWLYLAPLLFQQRFPVVARQLPTFVACVNIGAIAFWLGSASGVHVALFIFLTLPFQVFNVKTSRWSLALPIIMCALLFLAIQLDAIPRFEDVALTETAERSLRAAFGIGTVIIFSFILGYFYASNQSYEDALASANSKKALAIEALTETQHSLTLARVQADSGLRARGDFLGMVSHELNTPLMGIVGSIDELLQVSLDPHEEEPLQLLKKSGLRLSALLRKAVDFVQLDRDAQSLNMAPFDLVRSIEETETLFAEAAREKKLLWTVKLSGQLRFLVVGDQQRVGQVIEYVVDNAIRYTETGSVRLDAQLREQDGRALLQLRVTDTGPGLSQALKESVFSGFAQAVDPKHRGADGLGLGLALTGKLVALMGGQILLQDQPGGGTELDIRLSFLSSTLPRSCTTGEGTKTHSQRGGQSPRVLLAEDNPTSRRLLVRTLTGLGLQVTEVGNGQEAVNQWKEGYFDLLLFDVQMPVLDGLDAARQIRAQEEERTPLVFLTANTSAEQEQEARGLGIEGYLTKPCPPAVLRQLLQELGIHLASESPSTARSTVA